MSKYCIHRNPICAAVEFRDRRGWVWVRNIDDSTIPHVWTDGNQHWLFCSDCHVDILQENPPTIHEQPIPEDVLHV